MVNGLTLTATEMDEELFGAAILRNEWCCMDGLCNKKQKRFFPP